MDRLIEIVILTGDMAGMRRFYADQVGLAVREDSPDWVTFDTAGAILALQPMADAGRRGVQLQMASGNLVERVRDLSSRGATFVLPGIEKYPWGLLAHLRDPEGNPLALFQPLEPRDAGTGLALSAAINCRDMEGQKRFYRDLLGFAATLDSPWWVQLAAGGAGLGLHPRTGETAEPNGEGHHARPITIGLTVPDLAAWHEERSALGLAFTSPPTDRGYGIYADAVDPDGNPVTFRQAPDAGVEPETLEEQLAEPFESDEAPTHTGMRKPVHKRAKATSRVATRPQYRSNPRPARRRTAAKPAARVASPRGTGPAGTRQKPKRKRDPKRARTKPAIGRLRKAERRTFKSQKEAIAGASKRKPVKRASRARAVKRGVVRRASARRTSGRGGSVRG